MTKTSRPDVDEHAVSTLKRDVEAMDLDARDGVEELRSRTVVDRLLDTLEQGDVRAATRQGDGVWKAEPWVKRGILAAFRLGRIRAMGDGDLTYVDVDSLPPRRFDESQRIRIVPGGTAVRRGAHLGNGTICMPPAYVNVGAYVGSHSMVDSHALVGSCAQVGSRVHLSAAVQVGGVLEPVGAVPVVIEDDVFVGGGCGIYEGCIVRAAAVLAPGVILSRSTPVYDLVEERVIRADKDVPLEIPSGAVVVPGTRPATSAFARSEGVSVYAPVIVKYRDQRTDAATVLEQSLRDLG